MENNESSIDNINYETKVFNKLNQINSNSDILGILLNMNLLQMTLYSIIVKNQAKY